VLIYCTCAHADYPSNIALTLSGLRAQIDERFAEVGESSTLRFCQLPDVIQLFCLRLEIPDLLLQRRHFRPPSYKDNVYLMKIEVLRKGCHLHVLQCSYASDKINDEKFYVYLAEIARGFELGAETSYGRADLRRLTNNGQADEGFINSAWPE
jgi:hypothetical protein